MWKFFRPRQFRSLTTRKFTPNTNLFGRALKGEGKKLTANKVAGFEKMALNKLAFFHMTGNVFTAYCLMKATGWLFSVYDRKQNKIYDDMLMELVESKTGTNAANIGKFYSVSAGIEDSAYAKYLDQYTMELGIALPIIFVLGAYTNRKFGSVYSMKLLLASYGLGMGLKHFRFGAPSHEIEGTSLTVASALVTHTLFRVGVPVSISLL